MIKERRDQFLNKQECRPHPQYSWNFSGRNSGKIPDVAAPMPGGGIRGWFCILLLLNNCPTGVPGKAIQELA